MKKILFFLLFGLVAFNAQAAQPYFENDKLSLDIGLTMNNQLLACFNIKDGWHISYQNAGDAGVPTSFEFENMSADLLNQSAPEKFLYEDIITQYGYGKAACYLFAYSDSSDNAAISISWTACKDYCEPEDPGLPAAGVQRGKRIPGAESAAQALCRDLQSADFLQADGSGEDHCAVGCAGRTGQSAGTSRFLRLRRTAL